MKLSSTTALDLFKPDAFALNLFFLGKKEIPVDEQQVVVMLLKVLYESNREQGIKLS